MLAISVSVAIPVSVSMVFVFAMRIAFVIPMACIVVPVIIMIVLIIVIIVMFIPLVAVLVSMFTALTGMSAAGAFTDRSLLMPVIPPVILHFMLLKMDIWCFAVIIRHHHFISPVQVIIPVTR